MKKGVGKRAKKKENPFKGCVKEKGVPYNEP
jgi:hypothetical protein